MTSIMLPPLMLPCLLLQSKMSLSISICPLRSFEDNVCDGASAMSSLKCGVPKRISDLEPQAVYNHCYGHALNLAAGDTLKQSKVMKDALETTWKITKLIKYSPRRDGRPCLLEALLTSGFSAVRDGQFALSPFTASWPIMKP